MKTFQTDLPAMYGDHHVTEVRKLISSIPGVEDLYEVRHSTILWRPEEILAKLEEAGYLGELLMPQETNLPATELADKKSFRHTAAFEQTKQVSFHRETSFAGRPLWPCPGMGPLKKVEE